MRTITAIEPQRKNPQRVNIHLDGNFAFGLAAITAAWLKTGQELSEEKIIALQVEDKKETIYQNALHFLSFRPRSSQEIRRHLLNKSYPEALVDENIERLQDASLVNDESFARSWVENRNIFHPRSKSALRMELRQKGLDDDLVQLVLEEMVDEETLAVKAAQKQGRRYASLEWPDFRKKLGGFLTRLGFSYSVAAPVVSQVWEEIQAADPGSTFNDKD